MALSREELESMIGSKCGQLTILEYLGFYAHNSLKKRHWYKCQCSCGNIIEVDRTHLKENTPRTTTSCGCSRKIHGYHNHPAYNSYRCMIGRVKRPDPYKHKHYIENNIQICEEWDGHPDVFCKWADENGFKKGLTLDRIDNYGNYTPENCRWVDATTQSNNRPSYNHNLTFNGKTQSIAMWARELNIAPSTLSSRILEQGMTAEEALSTPVDKKYSHS